MTWLLFALMTVACWGLYGILLHSGSVAMGGGPTSRYKAFFCVGVAYLLTAVIAPAAIIMVKGGGWSMPAAGIKWSLLAGVVGAVGAFCVLLAFGAKGRPPEVMSIIFAGAPVVNAIVAMSLHPPAGGWSSLPKPFIAGIVLAALGGCLVTLYKPAPGPAKAPAVSIEKPSPE